MSRRLVPLALSRVHQCFPNGLKDRPRFERALQEVALSVGDTGAFIGDNVITWGRNLSFALDAHFMDAFQRASPSALEASLVWRVHLLYWAAHRGMKLSGDFVEAGCYAGFSARVISDAVEITKTDKRYWLYDRFDLPADHAQHLDHHDEGLFDRVTARFSDVPNVRIIKGEIPHSFQQGAPDAIAFMHIDMNSVSAEIGALEFLYDRVVPGGVIVFDDYGWNVYRDQKDAEDSWLTARGNMVFELPTGQGLLIK